MCLEASWSFDVVRVQCNNISRAHREVLSILVEGDSLHLPCFSTPACTGHRPEPQTLMRLCRKILS